PVVPDYAALPVSTRLQIARQLNVVHGRVGKVLSQRYALSIEQQQLALSSLEKPIKTRCASQVIAWKVLGIAVRVELIVGNSVAMICACLGRVSDQQARPKRLTRRPVQYFSAGSAAVM